MSRLPLPTRLLRSSCWPGLLLLGALACHAAHADDLGELQLKELQLSFDKHDRPLTITGQLALRFAEARSELCFYLPYHSERGRYPYNPLKHFDPLTARQKTVHRAEGSTSLQLVGGAASGLINQQQLNAAVLHFRFAQPRRKLKLEFVTSLAPTFTEGRDDYVFDGYYPMPLQDCPPRSLAPEELDIAVLPLHLRASVQVPPGWAIVGPGSQGQPPAAGSHVQLVSRGRSLAFAMARHYYHESVRTPLGPISLYALDPDFFASSRTTLVAALQAHGHWLGPLPFASLSVVESRSYQRAGLPGMLTLNRPQQFLFDYVQTNLLNWQHWALSALLAAQWYGGAIGVDHKNDEWLLAGISDFVNLEFLRLHHKRYNLFNSFDQDFRLLAMDYLQLQEATASLLHRAQPSSSLTDANLQSAQHFREQNPLIFVKHALALRYLKSTMGEAKLAGFLRRFTQSQLFKNTSPQQFLASLSRSGRSKTAANPPPSLASQQLEQWWTKMGWSNLSLLGFEKQQLANGQWLATASFKEDGAFRLPIQVGFRTSDGHHYLVQGQEATPGSRQATSQTTPRLYHAYAMTDLEPVEVTLDPHHNLFDPDRFDNSSRPAELRFFPGTASTLSDADYTAVWLPYAFRRPGQSLSVALQGALFRYLNSGVFLKVELSPHDRRGSYHIRYQHHSSQWPSLASELAVTHTYQGARTTALTLQQSPLLSLGSHQLMLGSTLRLRQQTGLPSDNHPTLAAAFKLYPAGTGHACSLVVSGEREQAVAFAGSAYAYQRQKGEASSLCTIHKNYDLQLRLFKGQAKTYSNSRLPEAGHFRINDLGEAGIRIDEASLPLADSIESLTADVYLPLMLPLPANSLILSKQVRLRAFYDVGRASMLNRQTRRDEAGSLYRAAGLGISLPFGGDLMGVGSLTLTRFSLLAVLYTQINGKNSQRPHFLFDLTGEL